MYGFGSSLYYFPILSLTPAFFDRHRGFALGLILSGAGVGGLILSPVMHALIVKYGVRWALRVLGLWNFAVGIPVSLVVKRKPGNMASGRGTTRLNMGVVTRGTFIWQVCPQSLSCGCSSYYDTLLIDDLVIRSLPASRGQHRAHILSDHVFCLSSVLFFCDRQLATSCQQYSQQRRAHIYGHTGR